MRLSTLLIVLLLLIPLTTATAAAETVEQVSPASEQAMLDLVNHERTSRGLAPLRMVDGPRAIARDWSRTMAEDSSLRHRTGLVDLFTGTWTRLAENVGVGSRVDSLHDAFMASSGHRANILHADHDWVGIGVVTTTVDRMWVTLNFGAGDSSVVGQFSTTEPRATSGAFRDVAARATFRSDIEWLAASGITKGCNPPDNDRFCPERVVTRQQMASFLVRGLDLPAGRARFKDVARGSTHAADIAALAAAGITKGCGSSGTRFCPGQAVTRQQMASFLVRALDLPAGRVRFADVPASSTHAADIAALAAAGITKGCGAGGTRFCPHQPVTRKQMAAFLHRALD